MRHNIRSFQGFNLIELVITIAIVAIFAAIAVPSYMDYTRRDYYSSIVQATMPYKVGVGKCYTATKKLTGCNGGTHSIPANITAPKDNIAFLTVRNGVITIVPVQSRGITAADNYILTPSIINKTLTWMPSGGAITKGYVDK